MPIRPVPLRPRPRPRPAPGNETSEFAVNQNASSSATPVEDSWTSGNVYTKRIFVGRGYNLLTNHYFRGDEVADGQILDFTGKPEMIGRDISQSTELSLMTESSMQKITKSWEESVKIEGAKDMFQGSLSETYSTSTTSSTERVYTKILVRANRCRYHLTDELWKSCIHKKFYEDLTGTAMTPAAFFKKYGTHLMLRCYYGGVMDLSTSVEKKMFDTTETIKSDLAITIGEKRKGAEKAVNDAKQNGGGSGGNASGGTVVNNNITLNSPTGGSAEGDKKKSEQQKPPTDYFGLTASTKITNSESNSIESLSFTGKVCGGGGIVPPDIKGFGDTLGKWLVNLMSEDNWDLCGVRNEDDLYPLWEICPEGRRKDELRRYFDEQIAYAANKYAMADRFVTDIQVVWGESSTDAKAKADALRKKGYVYIPKDLNKGCGSGTGFVYLCYQTMSKAQMAEQGVTPITNLSIYCGTKEMKSNDTPQNESIAEFWLKNNQVTLDGHDTYMEPINYHLNIGVSSSKGRFVQLCCTRDPFYKPLVALEVYHDDDYDAVHETGEWLDIPERGPNSMVNPRCCATSGTSNGASLYVVMKRQS